MVKGNIALLLELHQSGTVSNWVVDVDNINTVHLKHILINFGQTRRFCMIGDRSQCDIDDFV